MVIAVFPNLETCEWLPKLSVVDKACHPELELNKATFRLSFKDVYQCGVTRIYNWRTVRYVFL
jgi:hypothetical protein